MSNDTENRGMRNRTTEPGFIKPEYKWREIVCFVSKQDTAKGCRYLKHVRTVKVDAATQAIAQIGSSCHTVAVGESEYEEAKQSMRDLYNLVLSCPTLPNYPQD